MPRKPRESSGTGIYHVMLRGINRQDIFDDTEDYWTFIRMMSAVPCYIYAYRSEGQVIDLFFTDQRDRSLIFFP